MEGHCSTGQSPQWAVVPMEGEEEEEEEEEEDEEEEDEKKKKTKKKTKTKKKKTQCDWGTRTLHQAVTFHTWIYIHYGGKNIDFSVPKMYLFSISAGLGDFMRSLATFLHIIAPS